MEDTRFELKKYFGNAVDDEEVLNECIQLCSTFNLPAEDLFYKWEAHSFSTATKDRLMSSIDMDGTRELRTSLERERASQAKASTSTPSAKIKSQARPFGRASLGSSSRIPSTPASSKQPLRSAGPTPLKNSTSAAVAASPPVHRPSAKYVEPAKLSEYSYRYMYEKLSERAEMLDDLIEDMADRIKTSYGVEEIGDPASITENEILVVGRICSDSEEKPNDASLLIESSRVLGSGKRVLLQLSPSCKIVSELQNRPSWNFFAGQIAVLRGKNGNGLKFVVSEIFAPPRLLPQPIAERPSAGRSDATHIITASGPYSLEKDLDYDPWSKLVSAIIKSRPSVLILLGPFVDSHNTLIKKGAITQSPTDYFRQYIVGGLNSIVEAIPEISIFLVPSPRDIVHKHFAFPQRALDGEKLGLSKNIHLLPNPCVFNVNGLNIAVNSVDAISQIGTQQYAKAVENQVTSPMDGIQMIWLQLLEQRSLYPLFPVPYRESANVNLDVSHSHLLALDFAPDLMIVPSRLKGGSRIVDHTLCLNPSFVSRGTSADSYARITIPALSSISSSGTGVVKAEGDAMDIDGTAKIEGTDKGDYVNLAESIKVEMMKLS